MSSSISGILLMVSILVHPGTDGETKAVTDKPLGVADARHLLDRTCFGAPPAEIQKFAELTRTEAVEQLLATLKIEAETPLPEWHQLTAREVRNMRREDTRAFGKIQRGWQQEARSWWATELLTSGSPLTERLVLMWHGHFTSEMRTVRSPHAMLRQNQLFREQGAGKFDDLLRAIATDSAMAIYLDTQKSKKGKPNENFARELFELFSLGEGNYTEKDIQEAARAFTGYRINFTDGKIRKVARLHDRETKTVLGRRGRLDGIDVVNTVLTKPACGEWIARRFWLEFVSPTPDEKVLKAWGKFLRSADWDLRKFLAHILNSDQFWSEEYRGTLVKSPVDLVIGTLRRMETREIPGPLIQRNLLAMGQILFDPPNVAGWPGGNAWIDSTTLLERRKFLHEGMPGAMAYAMYSASANRSDRDAPRRKEQDPPMEPGMDPEMEPKMSPGMQKPPARWNRRMIRRYRPMAAQSVEKAYQQFIDGNAMNEEAWLLSWLPFQPVTDTDQSGTGFGRLEEIVLDPTYQLK